MTTIARDSAGRAAEDCRTRRADQEGAGPGRVPGRGLAPAGPLLPALIFMIVVTQIPFLFTLYYSTLSWNLVRPGSRQIRRPAELHRRGRRTASSGRSRSTPSS